MQTKQKFIEAFRPLDVVVTEEDMEVLVVEVTKVATQEDEVDTVVEAVEEEVAVKDKAEDSMGVQGIVTTGIF